MSVTPYAKRRGHHFTLKDFINDSRSVGVLLVLCTLASLVITNLPEIGVKYNAFWEKGLPGFHSLHLPHTVLHFINDALMAFFFFQVGMEIKREAVIGELSSPTRMMLPLFSALSGVIFPAVIFLIATKGTDYQNGWAIPTATDIAFSLGILSLLGRAVPHSFKVFLTALAIIDDLCAILIIAFFYGSHPNLWWLIGVALCVAVIILTVKLFKDKPICRFFYLILGVIMWYCMYQSGIHATFAGVLLSALLPVNKIPTFEKALNVPVNFFIIPIFALANTSIFINAAAIGNLSSSLSLGIIFGLLIGKPLGISLAVYIMTKLRMVKMKGDNGWKTFMGVGILAGIGFTMSIFVSTLAFENNELYRDTAKLSVLIASTLSMIIGYAWLKIVTRKNGKIFSKQESMKHIAERRKLS